VVGAVCLANFNKRVPKNVPGEFFVDATCIDCDTCRQLAPATFGETTAYAFVHTQPQTAEATWCDARAALLPLAPSRFLTRRVCGAYCGLLLLPFSTCCAC
jgi:hypothetical protein